MKTVSWLSPELQEELLDVSRRFIKYGMILDVPTRKYLVAWVQSKLVRNYELPEELQAGYFTRFERELALVLEDQALVEMCQKHDHLAVQVAKDVIHWLKNTIAKARANHPYEDELQLLQGWSIRGFRQFEKSWNFLIKAAQSNYTTADFAVDFYKKEFEAIWDANEDQFLPGKQERAEELLVDILSEWDARLQAKILAFQLKHFKQDLEEFASNLVGKAKEFKQLTEIVEPFEEYAGQYWNMSEGLWKSSSFNVLEKYRELLQKEDELKRLADLLGQLREAELTTEEEQYYDVEIRESKKHDPRLKSEIVGVFESNDLNQILTSEVVYLDDTDTETVFFKKFADDALLTHQYKDFEVIQEGKPTGYKRELQRRKEKGPFIICVDTSGSMEGTPEHIAKVLCFGILKMAAAQNRKAFLINFSTGIQVMDLQQISSHVDDLAKFLTMSFEGGTDITLALSEALIQLESKNYQEADVLVISDFVMYKLDQRLVQTMHHQQAQKSTRFHSLIISDEPVKEVIDVFDDVWVYNPEQKGIMHALNRELDVFRV